MHRATGIVGFRLRVRTLGTGSAIVRSCLVERTFAATSAKVRFTTADQTRSGAVIGACGRRESTDTVEKRPLLTEADVVQLEHEHG